MALAWDVKRPHVMRRAATLPPQWSGARIDAVKRRQVQASARKCTLLHACEC